MKKGSGPHAAWQELKLEAKRRPRVTAVYLILRLIVLVTMVSAILRQEYESVFICLLVLVLFLLPVFYRKNSASSCRTRWKSSSCSLSLRQRFSVSCNAIS